MEAKKLMIGDWVSVSGTPMRIAALGTVKAGFLDGKGEMFYHGYDSIEPIPLTNEFLEMNGFKKGTERFWHKQCEEDFRLLIDTQALNNLLYKENDALLWVFTDGFCELRTKVRFVHELQHAMRVMGIKKEFEPW